MEQAASPVGLEAVYVRQLAEFDQPVELDDFCLVDRRALDANVPA